MRSKLATRIADKKETYKSNWLYAKRHNCSLTADLKADHKKVRELSEQQNSAGF